MTSVWDERTDNVLRGIGVSHAAPEEPPDSTPGTQADPDGNYRLKVGRFGVYLEKQGAE